MITFRPEGLDNPDLAYLPEHLRVPAAFKHAKWCAAIEAGWIDPPTPETSAAHEAAHAIVATAVEFKVVGAEISVQTVELNGRSVELVGGTVRSMNDGLRDAGTPNFNCAKALLLSAGTVVEELQSGKRARFPEPHAAEMLEAGWLIHQVAHTMRGDLIRLTAAFRPMIAEILVQNHEAFEELTKALLADHGVMGRRLEAILKKVKRFDLHHRVQFYADVDLPHDPFVWMGVPRI